MLLQVPQSNFARQLVVNPLHLGKSLKERLASLEEDLVRLTDELQQEAQCIPNMSHPDVPIGEEDSSVVRKMVFDSCNS